MSDKKELKALKHFENYGWVYDPKKNQSFIEDKATLMGASTCRAIGSGETDAFIQKEILNEFGYLISDVSLNRINKILSFYIKDKGIKSNVRFRLEKIGNNIYINTGVGRIIKINKKEVIILKKSNVKFEITNSLGRMVRPDLENGNINLLKKYLPVSEVQFKLIIVYILDCYFMDTHFSLLRIMGAAGTGKSWLEYVIKTVTDASNESLRNNFKKVDDLILAAVHSHVIAINNVSKLTDSIQDTLCTILTGGVATARTLYTNKEQTSIHTKNPVVMNGIGEYVTKDDLLARSIGIRLKNLQESNIKVVSEKQLLSMFELDLPMIMGGIFNALSLCLKHSENFVPPEKLNRMADFHILGCIAEKALGWEQDSFINAYNANLNAAHYDVIDNSEVAQGILKMKEEKSDTFIGSYKELTDELNDHVDLGKIMPRALSTEIDRISNALRKLYGIKITKHTRKSKGSQLRICF